MWQSSEQWNVWIVEQHLLEKNFLTLSIPGNSYHQLPPGYKGPFWVFKKSFCEYCKVRMKKKFFLGILIKNKYNMQHCKSTIYE